MPAKAVLQYVTIRDGIAVPHLDRELKLIECDLPSASSMQYGSGNCTASVQQDRGVAA